MARPEHSVPRPGPEPALDLDRLQQIGAHLGQPASAVAATLREELQRAAADVDAGLTAGDARSVASAAHAARNSALMIAARPALAGLDRLETAARAGDLTVAADAAAALREPWSALLSRLARAAGIEA